MKNHLKTQTEKWTSMLHIAESFAEKFGEQLPEGLASITVFGATPELYVSSGYSTDDRNRVLLLIGDLFGRSGWSRSVDYGRESFSWKKIVDGVSIVLSRVESVEIPADKSPVPPAAFPLQLADL